MNLVQMLTAEEGRAMSDQDTNQPHGGRLKFDPTINAGHLLTFAGFIVAGFVGWTTLDKRVGLHGIRHKWNMGVRGQPLRCNQNYNQGRLCTCCN